MEGRERESVPPCRRRGRKTAGKRTPESLRKLRPAAAPIGGRRLSQPHVPSFRASSRLAAWLSNWHAEVLSRTVSSRSLVSSLSSSPLRSLLPSRNFSLSLSVFFLLLYSFFIPESRFHSPRHDALMIYALLPVTVAVLVRD